MGPAVDPLVGETGEAIKKWDKDSKSDFNLTKHIIYKNLYLQYKNNPMFSLKQVPQNSGTQFSEGGTFVVGDIGVEGGA